jgi:hypothetical protein
MEPSILTHIFFFSPILGTITCSLVQSHKKRFQHLNNSELAALEMRQGGYLMVKMKVIHFHYSYTCAGFQATAIFAYQ